MSKRRDKHREWRRSEWQQLARDGVAAARKRIGLDIDDHVPDEVLALEAQRLIPRANETGSIHHSACALEQWAGFRLIGLADSAFERVKLAERLRVAYTAPPAGQSPSRRSPSSGRRRNLRRRPA